MQGAACKSSCPRSSHCPPLDVDTVIIRENTEGEYCGVEHEVGWG